jgi:hypothetical protein
LIFQNLAVSQNRTYAKVFFFIFIVLLFSEILLPVLWMTGRDIGPNLQRRNAETEAVTAVETEAGTEAGTEAVTDTEERNGNTNTEDQVLVQGEKEKEKEREGGERKTERKGV